MTQPTFCFYIDDSFFDDGISIEIIRDFKILFEVARQLEASTYYNKTKFNNAVKKIEDKHKKPSLIKKAIEFVEDFIGKDNYSFSENTINIFFSKKVNIDENFFNNAKDTWTFINTKLPKRKFNNQYTKHGRKLENGNLIKAQRGESQLLTTDGESQSLLKDAIFDKRKRKNFYVNFDVENNMYILFPNENTKENTFHAFHILKNEWTKLVPTSIIKYYQNF